MRPFDLNFRHLRALDVVIRHGRMRAAADALGMSQPTLTQAVARLEAQLGSSLFDRLPHGVVPTDAGRIMAGRAVRAAEFLARTAKQAARDGTRSFGSAEHLVTNTQLRALVALADHGSFVEASAAIGLSEPSLHRAVRDLERVIGTPLAERSGRGLLLTGPGRGLARGARLAAAEIAAGISDLAEGGPTGGRDRRIIVGVMPLARARVLPRAIAALHRDDPTITVEVVEGSWRELVGPLRDGALDLMLGALRSEASRTFEQTPLFTDRLVVVGRSGHPATRGNAGVPELAEYPWIVGRAGSPLRGHWRTMFGDRVVAGPIESGSVMVARNVLIATDMLTLLSPDQVSLEVAAGVLEIVCEPQELPPRTIGLIVRRGWHPTVAQRRLLDLLREASVEDTSGLPIGVTTNRMEASRRDD